MAMPFTTPLSSAATDARSTSSEDQSSSQVGTPEKGLQEAPDSKKPRTLWQKIQHSFDFGNSGEQG